MKAMGQEVHGNLFVRKSEVRMAVRVYKVSFRHVTRTIVTAMISDITSLS